MDSEGSGNFTDRDIDDVYYPSRLLFSEHRLAPDQTKEQNDHASH